MLEKIKNFIKEHQGGISTVIGILGIAFVTLWTGAGTPDLTSEEGMRLFIEFLENLNIYGILAMIVSIFFAIKEKYLKD